MMNKQQEAASYQEPLQIQSKQIQDEYFKDQKDQEKGFSEDSIPRHDIQALQRVTGSTKNVLYIKSPKFDVYQKEFKKGRVIPSIQSLLEKIIGNQFAYLSIFKSPFKFTMHKAYQSRSKKIMYFEVRFSHFINCVKIFNIGSKSHLDLRFKNWVNEGVFGAIYSFTKNNKKFAIKKLPLDSKNKLRSIKNAIKQFCIMKLSSVLEIGPAFQNLFGFDLVITETDIYFSCQMGISIYDYAKEYSKTVHQLEKDFDKLQEKLLLLHSLSITHNDIKPNNIIYSPTYKSLVFIDFGLSRANQQILGFMKPEKPKGSIHYCCEQMRKLFFQNFSTGLVDLYYNDMIAFQKTKQNFFKMSENRFMANESNQTSKYSKKKQNNNSHQYLDLIHQHQGNLHETINDSQNILEQENVVCIELIYLIFEKHIDEIKEVLKQNSLALNILKQNLNCIYFIFYQTSKSNSLLKVYIIISDVIKEMDDEVFPLTKQILNNKLEPYFRRQTFENGESISKFFIQNYIKSQQKSMLNLSKRYQENKLQANMMQNQQVTVETVFIRCLQTSEQLIQLMQKRIHEHGYEFLQSIIRYQCTTIDFYRIQLERIQTQLSHFEYIFQKIGIRVVFELFNQDDKPVPIPLAKKFIFYLRHFTAFYIRQIKNYRLGSVIGKLLLSQTQFPAPLLLQILKALRYEKVFNFQTNQQLTKQEQYAFFVKDSTLKFKTFQLCLLIVDKFINTLEYFFQKKNTFQIPDNYIQSIQQKINEILFIHFVTYYLSNNCQKIIQMFNIIHYTLQMVFCKCLYFRKRTLAYLFIKNLQTNNLCNLIQIYQKIFFIWQNLKINIIFSLQQRIKQKLKIYLKSANKEIQAQDCEYLNMEKDFFQLLIYTTLIPKEHYLKYKILHKYFNFFQRIRLSKIHIKSNSFIQYYSISMSFKMAMQIDDFVTVQTMFDYIEKQKKYVFNEKLAYSLYYYYKKCNNSKKIKQLDRKMKKVTDQQLKSQFDPYSLYQTLHQQQINSKLNQKIYYQNDPDYFNQDIEMKIVKKQVKKILKQQHEAKESQHFEKFQDMNSIEYLVNKLVNSQLSTDKLLIELIDTHQKIIEKQQAQFNQKLYLFQKSKFLYQNICLFLSQPKLTQYQLLLKLKKQFSISVRSLVLFSMTSNYFKLTDAKYLIVLQQWKKFEAFVRQQYSEFQVQNPPFEYYLLKFRVKRLAFYESIRRQNTNNQVLSSYLKLQYQKSCILFIKKMLESKSNFQQKIDFSQHSNPVLSNIQVSQIQNMQSFANDQALIVIINDCYAKLIKCSCIQKHNNSSQSLNFFLGQQFTIQQKCKRIFYNLVISKKIYYFFLLNNSVIKFLGNIIEIGTNQIFKFKNKGFDNYFIVFFFFHILKFIEKSQCSSYSYIFLGIIKTFENQIRKTKMDNSEVKNNLIYLENKIIKLNQFQIDFFKNQALNLPEAIIILLSCERMKLQIAKKLNHFKTKKDIRNKKQDFHSLNEKNTQQQNLLKQLGFKEEFKSQDKEKNKTLKPQNQIYLQKDKERILKRILIHISSKIPKLEYLSKTYMKHSFYLHIIDFLNENEKSNFYGQYKNLIGLSNILLSFKTNIQGQNTQKCTKMNVEKIKQDRKIKYFEMKLFRNCRKTSKILNSQFVKPTHYFLDQKIYYVNFKQIDQKYVKQLIYKKFSQSKNQNSTKKMDLQRIHEIMKIKIDRFIQISSHDQK